MTVVFNSFCNSFDINNITSRGASKLFNTLKECNAPVERVSLSNNQLDDDCLKPLGEFVQDNQHLEYVALSSNRITDKGVEILLEYLVGNTMLKELRICGSFEITDMSASYFVDMAKKSCITEIAVWATLISENKKEEMANFLAIPADEREIPIKSRTKSAAKISFA